MRLYSGMYIDTLIGVFLDRKLWGMFFYFGTGADF